MPPTQISDPSKARAVEYEKTRKVPSRAPSEALSFITLPLYWLATQILAPSKVKATGKLPTGKVPSGLPSEAMF